MRVLLLGAGGMLGHKILQALTRHDVVSTVHGRKPPMLPEALEGIDVTDPTVLDDLYRAVDPEVVINCVGVIKQRVTTPIESITVNALLPHQLAARGVRVIHFSTDCVFSGRKGNYTLNDTPDATDLYGRTKLLGEIAGPNSLTLRTSIIGRELAHFQSLVEWFLTQSKVQGYRRTLYSGVTTNWLASVVAELLDSDLTGVWQIAGPVISKHDLLVLIRDAYDTDTVITPDDIEISDRTLDGSEFATVTGIVAPPWPEMIQGMIDDPTPYLEWR